MKSATLLRNQNRIEKQRQVARNIRRMEGKAKGGSTTQVKIINEDNIVTDLTHKDDINNTIAEGNEKVGHQKRGSQLLNHEFIQTLGNHGKDPEKKQC